MIVPSDHHFFNSDDESIVGSGDILPCFSEHMIHLRQCGFIIKTLEQLFSSSKEQ